MSPLCAAGPRDHQRRPGGGGRGRRLAPAAAAPPRRLRRPGAGRQGETRVRIQKNRCSGTLCLTFAPRLPSLRARARLGPHAVRVRRSGTPLRWHSTSCACRRRSPPRRPPRSPTSRRDPSGEREGAHATRNFIFFFQSSERQPLLGAPRKRLTVPRALRRLQRLLPLHAPPARAAAAGAAPPGGGGRGHGPRAQPPGQRGARGGRRPF